MCARAIHDGEDGDDVVDARVRESVEENSCSCSAAGCTLHTAFSQACAHRYVPVRVLCRVRSTPLHTLLGVTQHEHCLRCQALSKLGQLT